MHCVLRRRLSFLALAIQLALLWTPALCLAFASPTTRTNRVWKQLHSSSSSSSSSLGSTTTTTTTTTTLNDDGDFVIQGLNDDDDYSFMTTTNTQRSLLDVSLDYSSHNSQEEQEDHLGRRLQQELQQLRAPASDSYSLSSSTMEFSSLENDSGPPNLASFDKEQPPQVQHQAQPHLLPPPHVAQLQDFVTMILPQLSADDLRAYIVGLHAIGFDPDCESSRHLQFDDLDHFGMKPLHQRYFWQEWQKLVVE